MFFRLKKSGERTYIQIVENKRIDGAVRQSVIANLGRADELAAYAAVASRPLPDTGTCAFARSGERIVWKDFTPRRRLCSPTELKSRAPSVSEVRILRDRAA